MNAILEPAVTTPTIRLGAVSYLNTLPLIEGLGKLADVSLTLSAPSGLIGMLAEGRVDLALASVIDAPRSPVPVAFVPVGMIGSDGPTLTVRLFSRTSIEGLARVHADADSHTSVALLRLVLAERFGVRPEIVDFDAERGGHCGEWPDAVLLIGDKVVTRPPSVESHPHQVDLGEAWRAMTGLPFVYAAWMCRLSDADSPAVRTAASLLDRQRRHNGTRLGWIAAARSSARGWQTGVAARYLESHLRFDVSAEAREAVELFFDRCADEGVLAGRREVPWVEWAA